MSPLTYTLPPDLEADIALEAAESRVATEALLPLVLRDGLQLRRNRRLGAAAANAARTPEARRALARKAVTAREAARRARATPSSE
jgi:hypothetical protein